MTVHVMAPPDEGALKDDESLCTERRETVVVFHCHCRGMPAGGFVCLDCGETSTRYPDRPTH